MKEENNQEFRGVEAGVLFGAIFVFMGIHLFFLNLSIPSISVYWIAFLVLSVFRLKREWNSEGSEVRLERLRTLLFLGAILMNGIGYKYIGVYIPQHILVVCGGLLVIYIDIRKVFAQKKKYILGIFILLCALFWAGDTYMYMDHIFNNRDLAQFVKTHYKINRKIEMDDLNRITVLNTFLDSDLRSLEGIEKLKNLETITLADRNHIQSYEPLSKLKQLESLTVWHPNLEKISEIDGLDTLKYLHLYSKEGHLDSLGDMPNLNLLYLQGVDFDTFEIFQELQNLERLTIVSCEIGSYFGFADLEHLKEITISNMQIETYSVLLQNPNVIKIVLDDVEITDVEAFKKEA